MAKEVLCVNDANQPPGGEVVEGQNYTVKSQFVNLAGQCVYIIEGVNNEGTTKYGFSWKGYRCERFMTLEAIGQEVSEVAYLMN